MLPATKFSGDLIASALSPDGQLHVLFADVSGHGLSSALFQIPAVDSFKTQVASGSSVNVIARALNARLKALSRTGYFMAAIVVRRDALENRLTIWNGGMPGAWLLGDAGDVRTHTKSSHVALGVLPDESFDDTVTITDNPNGLQLLMLSDGFLEAVNSNNEEFGEDRLMTTLRQTTPDTRVEGLMASVFAHQREAPQHDDISVALLELLLYPNAACR